MKNLFLIAIIVLGFTVNSFAQVKATATASATIIAPITLVKVNDMNFGNIAVDATLAGTVVLLPDGTRSATGGVTATAILGGTITAAVFTVGGEGSNTYAITIPKVAHTIKHATTTDVMVVNAFTSTPTTTGILTAGTQTLQVGATLNVSANQKAGLYTSTTPFDVTVNYN